MKGKLKQMEQKHYILSHVQPMLVSGSTKGDLQIREIPYEEYLDLVLFCYIPADVGRNVPITDELLTEAGITWGEIVKAAIENLEQIYTIDYMENVIARTMGITFDGIPQNMLVASNNRMDHGASVIASQVILKAIEDRMGGDYVVLPSSIHEVVCVPYGDVTSLTDMVRMVTNVNDAEVREEDRLSYNAYWYHDGQLIATV